jgi:hypothetical protein
MTSHRFALILGAGLLLAVPTLAAPPIPAPPAQFAGTVKELHEIIQVLEVAKHDYDGHRAAAVHEIHKAIRALHPHHKPPVATKPAPKTTPLPGETQAMSDVLLKQALDALLVLHPKLTGSSKPEEVKSAADLATAIAELKIALAIK